MPRTGRFDDGDLSHQQGLRILVAWLRRKMRSRSAPVALANRHLAEHERAEHRKCKLCGAAWAIFHCDVALKEEASHRMLESLARSRQSLKRPWLRLRDGVVRFADAKRNRKHKTLDDVPAELALPATLSKEAVAILPAEIKRVLFAFRQLEHSMIAAERDLSKRHITPTLNEHPARRARDYLRTAIDCYLFRHGWKAKEIFTLFHPKGPPDPRLVGLIYDRVERARKSGRPPLLGGWPPRKERATQSRSGQGTTR